MSDIDPVPSSLFGHWIHSHEDDHDGVEVYRPATFPFPPSRGRRGFELYADGQATYHGIGPVDRPVASGARWHSDSDGRICLEMEGERSPLCFEIVAVSSERLEVRRG